MRNIRGAPKEKTCTAGSSGSPTRNHRGGRTNPASAHNNFSPHVSSAAIMAVAATCAPTIAGAASMEG
jgi:hypothetical protein